MRRAFDTAQVVLSVLPLANAVYNLRLIRRLPPARPTPAAISVLVPVRDESGRIEAALRHVLASRDVAFEIVVLDDGSTDGTGDVVRAIGDPRIRLIAGTALPDGWRGKNHACAQAALAACHETLVFVDADVHLAPETLARIGRVMSAPGAPDLLSGVPRQITRGPFEWLLLPLIQVLLAGYLPLAFDRDNRAGMAAACGQLVVAKAGAYRAMGGHGAVRDRLHDALALARAMRRAGFRTRLIDATDLATCRMYDTAADVWSGLAKNATEGLATRRGLPVWTGLLGIAHVLPFLRGGSIMVWIARACSLALRALVARRFAQGPATVLASPIGVALLLGVQWHAYIRHRVGRTVGWRGRTYETH